MNYRRYLKGSLSLLASLLVLGSLTGCLGVVGEGPDFVAVGGPDIIVGGGYGYYHGHDRVASHRGYVSRRAAGHVPVPHGPIGHGGGRHR